MGPLLHKGSTARLGTISLYLSIERWKEQVLFSQLRTKGAKVQLVFPFFCHHIFLPAFLFAAIAKLPCRLRKTIDWMYYQSTNPRLASDYNCDYNMD
jgi:hypothetical protein